MALLKIDNKSEEIQDKKICRLCAKEQGTLNVFDKSDKNLPFSEQIFQCTQLEIQADDGLPSLICFHCSELLSTSFQFRQQCHTAQKQLREVFHIYHNFKVEIDSDIDEFDNEESWGTLKESPKSSRTTNIETETRKESTAVGKDKGNVSSSCCVKLESVVVSDYDNVKQNSTKLETQENVTFDSKTNNILVKQENEDPNDLFDFPLDTEDDQLDIKDDIYNIDNKLKLSSRFQVIVRSNKEYISCLKCGKKFKSRENAQKHVASHCSRDRRRNKTRKRKLNDAHIIHNEGIISNETDLEDAECIKTEAGETKEQYKCKFCNKEYRTRISLRRHKEKYCKHKDPVKNRNFMCEQCGRCFLQRSVLVQHMRCHSSKEYSCSLCHKTFTRSSHVIIHMRIHNNYKPYVCESCGRSFTKSSDLVRHKRIHSEAREYVCPLCPRAFKRSGDVTSHLRVHTGDRPYKCEPCSKSYTNYSSLRKHKLTNCQANKSIATK